MPKQQWGRRRDVVEAWGKGGSRGKVKKKGGPYLGAPLAGLASFSPCNPGIKGLKIHLPKYFARLLKKVEHVCQKKMGSPTPRGTKPKTKTLKNLKILKKEIHQPRHLQKNNQKPFPETKIQRKFQKVKSPRCTLPPKKKTKKKIYLCLYRGTRTRPPRGYRCKIV